MEENNQVIQILEGQGLDQQQIAEILEELSKIDVGAIDPTTPSVGYNSTHIENELKKAMDKEENPWLRAKLAARIISNSLD